MLPAPLDRAPAPPLLKGIAFAPRILAEPPARVCPPCEHTTRAAPRVNPSTSVSTNAAREKVGADPLPVRPQPIAPVLPVRAMSHVRATAAAPDRARYPVKLHAGRYRHATPG